MPTDEKRTNAEIADAFRKLADLLESNPLMAQPYEGIESQILFFCHDRATFQATIHAFGAGAKGHDDDTLQFTPKFPLQIKVYGFKNQICESRRVKRMVPETVIEAQPARKATIIPAHTEEVTEYVCTPFLEPETTCKES